jgi:integrase/recombinase XerD
VLEHFYGRERAERMRATVVVGAHLDGFASWLAADGYAPVTIRGALRAAHDLGAPLKYRRRDVNTLDESLLLAFEKRSPLATSTVRGKSHGTALFLKYLRARDVVAERVTPPEEQPHPLVIRYCAWLTDERGVREMTASNYAPLASAMLRHVRGAPESLTAKGLRAFVLARASEVSPRWVVNIASRCRMFVRFLVVEGLCRPEIVAGVPRVASWRLATLPRYISSADVERVIGSCDLSSVRGIRDRAILLLLARLGLRAGDVASLTLDAIDWLEGRILVAGKSRREDWLPLPQEVGDALLRYLEAARPRVTSKALFFSTRPPISPATRWTVSTIAGRAIDRAGVKAPSRGAHVLRHSAATTMLRQGASLQEIGAVLRHVSIETTFHYAKVDRDLLASVAAPWPSVVGNPHGHLAAETRRLGSPWPGAI